jgi:hypothetical protein
VSTIRHEGSDAPVVSTIPVDVFYLNSLAIDVVVIKKHIWDLLLLIICLFLCGVLEVNKYIVDVWWVFTLFIVSSGVPRRTVISFRSFGAVRLS